MAIFSRLNIPLFACLLLLMGVSLAVISTTTSDAIEVSVDSFFTPYVIKQLKFFAIGWCAFFVFAWIDYNRLREWTWIFYVGMLLLLLGLFFAPSIQNVHRWYRIGGFFFQPSEYAKLVLVLSLSWFLEKKANDVGRLKTALQAFAIMAIPFLLILKQPDLGTALVFLPITLGLFYFGGIHRKVVTMLSILSCCGFFLVSLFFLGVIDHEELRPQATRVIKEYQYERLNPHSYHQQAAKTAIALGGWTGSGWHKGEYSKRKYLPAARTDSVFPAYAEEFGFIGVIFLLGIFFGLIYVSFQVATVAKDRFGGLLAVGIALYMGVHIIVNIGMMCGFLPITGVPLIMVSYGGSSTLATMSALGILQSIYSRRFTF